jgi:AraC family transcriptional regulator
MRIIYRHIPPTTVFYARGTGPYASSCAEAWQLMNGWLSQSGARKRVKQAFGIFRDNPRTTASELIRYDACVPVLSCPDIEPAPGIGRQTIPGGAFAVHTHVGAYDDAGALLSCLHGEVVPKRALTVDYDRPFMVIYLNDPLVTREMHRRTELCIPVLPMPMPLATNDEGHEGHEGYDVAEIARRLAG